MTGRFVSLTVILLGFSLTPTKSYMYQDIAAQRNEDRIRKFAGVIENRDSDTPNSDGESLNETRGL
jgi:hypothetical protein